MMFLRRIIVRDFKIINSADLSFSPKINCICGNNGEGKTCLLDAVYYLSMTKSFLSSSDRYTYSYGSSGAILHGSYSGGTPSEEDIAVSVSSDGTKTVRRNGKTYKRLSDHIGRIPVVVTSPSDTSLIHDSGEERRRFLNMMISQMDPEYLRSVVAYNRLLKQRNAALRQEGTPGMLLDTISERMCAPAEYVFGKRKEAVSMLAAKAGEFYRLISGGKENVELCYRSDLDRMPPAELFAASRQKDKVMGYTTSGVQRDDLELVMDGHPLRKCASQGQQKSFLIALKMAQYQVMSQSRETTPILLFDDLFDKLDSLRVSSLIRMVVEGGFGQIFITDTDRERLRRTVGGITDQGSFFNVASGVITEIN